MDKSNRIFILQMSCLVIFALVVLTAIVMSATVAKERIKQEEETKRTFHDNNKNNDRTFRFKFGKEGSENE